MKRVILFTLVVLSMLVNIDNKTFAADKKGKSTITKSTKVEVYYFHFTRRCTTCKAVESETKKALLTLYAVPIQKGQIVFNSINLDDKSSETIAKKCKAEGQSLLILSGQKRIDMTDQGFMYAISNPEKLKSEIKKNIDPLL